MNPNLAEILVANGTGAVLVVMLYLSRRTYYKRKTIGGKMFDFMLLITWVANIAEIISFLFDGLTEIKGYTYGDVLLCFSVIHTVVILKI